MAKKTPPATGDPAPQPPARWTNQRYPRTQPLGQARGEVVDPDIATLVAKICIAWPHTEDLMIHVFDRLLGLERGNIETARLLFTAVVNQKIRIDLMRELLERSRINRAKGPEYDLVLGEFKRLNELRNQYIHGRWWTHENGDTYLQTDNSLLFTHARYRKVTKKELEGFLLRVHALAAKVALEI